MAHEDKTVVLLEQLIGVVQDLLILQALEAGITAENVRALVGVDKVRVNRVSRVRRRIRKNSALAKRIDQ
jgi:hypothetical protein